MLVTKKFKFVYVYSRERDRGDRDRERKRRRSKSRDKDRERKRERRERRERERGERLEYIKTDDGGEVRIKEEPIDGKLLSKYHIFNNKNTCTAVWFHFISKLFSIIIVSYFLYFVMV